jgi:hypothetical protein
VASIQRLAECFGERAGEALYIFVAAAMAIAVSGFAAFFTGQPLLFPSLGPTASSVKSLTLFVLPKAELLGDCHDPVPGCASSDCTILCGCVGASCLLIPKSHSSSFAPSLILIVAQGAEETLHGPCGAR